MKQRILSIALVLCILISPQSVTHAYIESSLTQEYSVAKESDGIIPTPTQVYEAMIALREQAEYREGATWTDYEPYPKLKGNDYHWKGGKIDGKNISAVGCVAFAFILSDTAFGSLPARKYSTGRFEFEDIKVGDILRMNTDTHTVIVLEVNDVGVVIAEGNYNSKVHWGRTISKDIVMRDTSTYITRYPEGYVSPDDKEANKIIESGDFENGLAWKLTKAGTLTISGNGAMPDYNSTSEQPWNSNSSKIRKVIIENGVTSVGSCAFWGCGVFSAEIASSVKTIGNSAFRKSSIISTTIPSSVKTIGDSAFRLCQNLSSITISEGVETIVQNAFRGCTSLASIKLPASIGEVGTAAFMECSEMKSVTFAPGNKQVKLGDHIFAQCYWLLNVTLPKKIDRIGVEMFINCGMLGGVEIPEGAESIGEKAFASCSSLTVLIIPDSVTSIGIGAFSACALKDIYFTGSETQWKSVSKLGDTQTAVSKVNMHYNYIPGSDPIPTSAPDPSPSNTPVGDDVNTGIYVDSSCTNLAPLSVRTHYVNGGNVKQSDGTKNNYKTKNYYTKLQASNIVTVDKKGKTKTKKGKLVVGITASSNTPVLEKNKIKDASVSKIASASIKKDKVKVTAKSQSGTVYLWVMDTGDAKASACAKIVIKAAPSKLQIFAMSSNSANFSSDNKNVYKKDSIELGSTVKLYVYPTYKLNKQSKETKDASYNVSVATSSSNYFTAEQDSKDRYCFNVTAKALKNNKKTTGKIIIQCNENGKKATFTASAVNGVQSITLDSVTGMTQSTASGTAISEFTIAKSDTNKKTGSFSISTTKSSSAFNTTDKVKLYAMGDANGFDKAKMEKGKVKITSKPSSNQKKLTAKLGKDKKTVTVTAAKKIPATTDVYYLIMYNNKENAGYKVIKIRVTE